MLLLRYSKNAERGQFVTVMGDPDAIRDLYMQLTENHAVTDGAAIDQVNVLDMVGTDVTARVMGKPRTSARPIPAP
jgi:hypothetical protein